MWGIATALPADLSYYNRVYLIVALVYGLVSAANVWLILDRTELYARSVYAKERERTNKMLEDNEYVEQKIKETQ